MLHRFPSGHPRWTNAADIDLLPRDVVLIGSAIGQVEEKYLDVDMLILEGIAIVNELILTGESTPNGR
ncbi:hypothetical protein QVD17_06610 [Tagetes erecta]|uniref:Uncharacterized protein n=1 Tax=Tagetes erecta TaxID=13708 RepID=A0AAD8PBY5_TARER|nr:hypothetical protein QVD17_06610 [Tagetes erecta]